jgi:hypothetical protein
MKGFSKKILLSVFAFVAFAFVNGQSHSFVGGSNQAFYPNATGYMDCAIHIKNEGVESINLKYKKISVDFPTKWDFSFCDNINCITFFADSGDMAAIPSGDSESSMKVTVYPNGFADTAVVKYQVWNKLSPSKIDTIAFNIYVRWGANVNQVSSTVTCFPNPNKGQFTISGMSAISNIELTNLQGQKINVSEINQGNQSFVAVQNAVSGIYFLSYFEGGKKKNTTLVIQN